VAILSLVCSSNCHLHLVVEGGGVASDYGGDTWKETILTFNDVVALEFI
jgi:hypothetical protein